MKVIAPSAKSEPDPHWAAAGLTGGQRSTVRQLEEEGVCVADVVEVLGDCGWLRISDASHQLQITVDGDGSVLALEGPGRRAARLRTQ
jgi:hypothetical protein